MPRNKQILIGAKLAAILSIGDAYGSIRREPSFDIGGTKTDLAGHPTDPRQRQQPGNQAVLGQALNSGRSQASCLEKIWNSALRAL